MKNPQNKKYKHYDPGTLEFVSERSKPPSRSWYGKEENT